MTKENTKPAAPETLVETSQPGAIELSEQELQKVAGGQKVAPQQKYMEIKLTDVLISSYGSS